MSADQLVFSGRQRVFIGIPVDAAFNRQINQLLKPIKKPDVSIRWVPECNRHLTLAFLGNRTNRQMDALLCSFGEAYREISCFEYAFTKLTHFPRLSSRLIALTGDAGVALEQLSERTRAFLHHQDTGFDSKPFRPHITLGRIGRAKRLNAALDLPIEIFLPINSIKVYKSTLTECGSIYSTLKEVQLD